MKRVALLLFALALSFAACAQSGKVYRIGLLEMTPASANRANLDALLRGLRELGYTEGKNLVIDYRSADGRIDRFPDLVADLVRAKPDIIVARGTVPTLAAKDSGIPVVMSSSANPLGTRVVSSLARPGGNVTGLTSLTTELHGKRMELIKELLPGVKHIGLPLNMVNPNAPAQWKEVERAAHLLGLRAQVFDARDANTLARALETAAGQSVNALLINAEALMVANRRAIVDFAAKHKLPVMYSGREFVEAGGLISYAPDYRALYYRAAFYVDRILKGAKPGDLPIEQPAKLELVINMKAAKALGIAVPQQLLLRADEVIE